MNEFEQELSGLELSDEQVCAIEELCDRRAAGIALDRAGQLLHLVFLRVGGDSSAGCALRRALGFSGGISLGRAAKEFSISKQALHALQSKLEAQLGDLSFIARDQRARARAQYQPTAADPAEDLGQADDGEVPDSAPPILTGQVDLEQDDEGDPE